MMIKNDLHIRLRAIGKMVSDDAGNFYEAQGRQLRQLGELMMDEAGRVFEVCTTRETPPDILSYEKANGKASHDVRADSRNGKSNNPLAETPRQNRRTGQVEAVEHRTEKTDVPKLPAYQKLFADPGLRLQLEFGRIRREIAGQLQHPEQLQDNDRVECYAQFYEAGQTVPLAQIAAMELGNAAVQSQLHPLTKGKAQILGAAQLFKPTAHPFATEATARQLYPGQRVYSLRPIFDPTVILATKPIVPVVEKHAALRREIPPQYLHPLQFKYSREEVLYDMKTLPGTLPPECGLLSRWAFVYPLRLLKTLLTIFLSARRMKKWWTLLAGKNIEQQLWEITPPRGFSCHPSVRRWAENALAQAGYDSATMLLEWEIFWRRRGWS